MLNWNSTCTLDSEVVSGVRFTFHKFSAGRRAMVETDLAEFRELMRDKMIDYASAIENSGVRDNAGNLVMNVDGIPVDAGDSEVVKAQKRTKRNAFELWSSSLMNRYIRPAQLRAYIKKIDGIQIDGKVPTPEQFVTDGPEDLADEAWSFINANCGLSEQERKNSSSPSTSDGVEAGRPSSTIATSVDSADTSPSSTAANSTISQAA